MATTSKSFDSLLEAAFTAGTMHGAQLPPESGDYRQATRDAYRRWRARWAGLAHEDPYDVSYGEAVRRGLVQGEALPEPSGIDHGFADRDVTGGW